MLSDGLFAYLVARWSVLNTFEAAILRDFGEREDFERVLTHALRRSCGGRVLLSLMADGSLRLTGTKDPDISFGAVLLDLTAPVVPCSEESLALRVRVIDWRRCARCYDEALAQRSRHPCRSRRHRAKTARRKIAAGCFVLYFRQSKIACTVSSTVPLLSTMWSANLS